MRPSASCTAPTAAVIDDSSVTSSGSGLQPARSSTASRLRAVAYTVWPCAARCSAVARPIPVEQPVISTVCEALATAVAYAPVADSDPRIVEALVKQLTEWRRALDAGAHRVGWKIGINVSEAQRKLGISEPVIGHLTSDTQLSDGATFDGSAATELRVEPEVALHMGANGEISGYGAAIEIVDTGNPPSEV